MSDSIKKTIPHFLKYYAQTQPDSAAVIEGRGGKTITYGQLWHRIGSYAVFFKEHGLKPGDRVALLTSQTIEYLASYYGVMLAGGVPVPVEPSASAVRLIEIAEDFGSTLIAADKETGSDRDILRIGADAVPKDGGAEWSLPENADDTAVILYTTGTTGKSKGVVSSYRCRFSGADNVVQYYGITKDDGALVPQLLSHSGGLRRVEAMLVAGGSVVIMNPVMFFGDVFSALKKHQCTILQLVPAQVAQILRSSEKLLVSSNEQLRILSVGSAVIPEEHKERLREILPDVRLFNDFGSTEAIGSAYFEWSAYPPKADCVGTEAVHSRIVFLDDNGNVMDKTSRDNPGIIATEGDTLMSGYYGETELTAEVLRDGRVISADLGYRGSDGMVYICGRRTDIIVCGANKISPFEVENAALRIENVSECAVIGRPDSIMGQLPVLFYVSKDGREIAYEDMFPVMSEKLEPFKIPKSDNVIRIDRLPKTEGTGKVVKRELEALLK